MSPGELAAMLGTLVGAVVGAILVGMDARTVLERPSAPPRSAASPTPN